jgi:hypothetical protein
MREEGSPTGEGGAFGAPITGRPEAGEKGQP